jgi:hypothetical protein
MIRAVDRDRWLPMRRILGRLPPEANMRTAAWRALHSATASPLNPVQWGQVIPSGIFGNSIRYLDLFDQFDAPLSFNGRMMQEEQLHSMCARSPHGPLARTLSIEGFRFDITEVDGIAASKSSDRHFSSVQAFGADYASYKGATIDAAGLHSMLAHGEVRILSPERGDFVALRLWDGRLFLCNGGGSHHFAAAAHIAQQLRQPVPIRSTFKSVGLNVGTVKWLLSNFDMLVVRSDFHAAVHIGVLAGSCFELEVPNAVCPDAKLMLMLRDRNEQTGIVEHLKRHGAIDAAPWLSGQLELQLEGMNA